MVVGSQIVDALILGRGEITAPVVDLIEGCDGVAMSLATQSVFLRGVNDEIDTVHRMFLHEPGWVGP